MFSAFYLKAKALGLKLIGPVLAILVIVGAIMLASIGFKELRIGGLLGKLFGKKSVEAEVNTVSETRVDQNGIIIPPGVPDSKGIVQAVVVPLEDNGGLFSNPDTVKVTPPGSDTQVEIQLPDGVKAKDVAKVIIVEHEKYVVAVKDTSNVKPVDVESLLKKYGG